MEVQPEDDSLEIPPLEKISAHILDAIPKHVHPGSKAFREIVLFSLQNEGLGSGARNLEVSATHSYSGLGAEEKEGAEPMQYDDYASEGVTASGDAILNARGILAGDTKNDCFSSSSVHELASTLGKHELQPELATAIIRQFALALASVTTRDFVIKCQDETIATLKQQLNEAYASQTQLAEQVDNDQRSLRDFEEAQRALLLSLQAEKAALDVITRESAGIIHRQKVQIDSLLVQVGVLEKQREEFTKSVEHDKAFPQTPEDENERITRTLERDPSILHAIQTDNFEHFGTIPRHGDNPYCPLVYSLDSDIRVWFHGIGDVLDDWDAGKSELAKANLQDVFQDMEEKRLKIQSKLDSLLVPTHGNKISPRSSEIRTQYQLDHS